jgi:hypothetical protein
MSSLDDSKYVLDSGPQGFNDAEKARWDKGIEKAKKRVAATCKHLVKGKGTWNRPRRKWSTTAWHNYLNNGMAPTLDDIIVGAAPMPGDSVAYEDSVVDDTVEIVQDLPPDDPDLL